MRKQYYKVNVYKASELENINTGINPNTFVDHGEIITREFNTQNEVKSYLNKFSPGIKPFIHDDMITIIQYERYDDNPVDSYIMIDFERGEIDLYNCVYSFSVSKIIESELTSGEDLELLTKGE